MADDLRAKLKAKCGKDDTAFRKCLMKYEGNEEMRHKVCDFLEMKYYECAGSVVSPQEGKNLSSCFSSLKGTGRFKGRNNCEQELAPLREKVNGLNK